MRTRDIDPDTFKWSSDIHVLQFPLTWRMSSPVFGAYLTLAEALANVISPTRPICSFPDLSCGFTDAQVSTRHTVVCLFNQHVSPTRRRNQLIPHDRIRDRM